MSGLPPKRTSDLRHNEYTPSSKRAELGQARVRMSRFAPIRWLRPPGTRALDSPLTMSNSQSRSRGAARPGFDLGSVPEPRGAERRDDARVLRAPVRPAASEA